MCVTSSCRCRTWSRNHASRLEWGSRWRRTNHFCSSLVIYESWAAYLISSDTELIYSEMLLVHLIIVDCAYLMSPDCLVCSFTLVHLLFFSRYGTSCTRCYPWTSVVCPFFPLCIRISVWLIKIDHLCLKFLIITTCPVIIYWHWLNDLAET